MKKVVRFIIKFVNKATADSVPAYAAQVAFFVMLSFFPFMMLLVMIVSKLSVMNTNVLGYILRVVPSGLESYVAYIVDDVVNANVQSFTLITVFVSLWSAAKGIQALSTGLNKIYGVEQNKNYFLVRLICALYTLVFMVLCIVVIAIQAFGSQIAHKIIDNYPAFADATLLILSLKNVVTFLVIFIFLLLIYYQLPNRRGHMRHEFTGAVLASLAWMLMTRGFSVYIKYSADNSKMYGSMTSVVLIIIWLYIGMQIVLYGAEINYYLSDLIWKYREKYHMKKKAKREEKQKIKKNQKEKAKMYSFDEIANFDPEIAQAMTDEINRQDHNIELIASENIVSKAVMAAMGSPLTNKYAEGYPGKRYYGGCEYVDVVEDLARERANKLFGCEYVNVQPHSGAQANMAVFFAILQPGDTFMGMNLAHGGHLTHGSPVNMSGKYFNVVPYGVNDEGFIDYDEVLRIAKECKPKMIVAGASAYARAIDFKRFREIADEVGAVLMVDMAHIAGLVAAGLHQSPIPYAHVTTTTTHKTLRGPRGGMILSSNEVNEKYNFNKAVFPGIQGGPLMHVIAGKAVCLKEALTDEYKEYQKQVVKNAACLAQALTERGFKIVSGGTDNHLMLVDLQNLDLTGKEVEKLLDSVHITANKNTVPNDPKSPFVTSGIRLGTPAITTRGAKEDDMIVIADAIKAAVIDKDNDKAMALVKSITDKYPLYA